LKLKLDSLFYEENLKRVYPEDHFLSTIIGFASYDENEGLLKGRYGIEKYYDEILKGEKGLYFGVNKIKTEIPGADIVLNIDYFLQKYSEKILQEAVKKYQAEGGLISIVTNDGKILALAEEPNYNLNKFSEIKNYHTFLTKFVQNYEPGSVIKTITFFAGLDNNVFKASDKYFDSGYIKVDNWTIYNFDKKGRGEVTFEQAFEQSLNTGAMHIQKLLGNYRFLSYLKKFRFNLKPFIDFPNLNDGNIKNLEKSPRDLRDVNFLTASFGHGISISPVHLIQASTVFANKGEMVKLNFVDRINFSDGSIEKNTKKIVTKIGSEESINEIKYLLEQVTLDGGGKKAKTEGYRIGGKTGSAYIPKVNEPGYSDDVINTYIALFPLSNPKFIIFVRIDKPNQGLAMVTTVPVAKKVIDYLIDYYNIPPDDIQE
jgi:cell division protein FtsI/penicillin-binding protein 2